MPTMGFQWQDYSRDFRSAEWGPTVILRSNNPQDRMSALGQKRTHAPQQAALFDHFVGERKDRFWDGQTERFRGLVINHQLVFGRLLDRQLPRFITFEDAVDV